MWGAGGSHGRGGTLSSMETKQEAGREEQKCIVLSPFISNPPSVLMFARKDHNSDLSLNFKWEPKWKVKQQSPLPKLQSSKIIEIQSWCHAQNADKHI